MKSPSLLSTINLGLHEPQLPVERSVTLVSSNVVERRCGALKRASNCVASQRR